VNEYIFKVRYFLKCGFYNYNVILLFIHSKTSCFTLQDNNWSDDDGDYNFDERHNESSHTEIIDRCNFDHGHLINARLSLNRSLLQEEISTIKYTKTQDLTQTGTDNVNLTHKTNKTYSTVLKFISEALVGRANYSDIYVYTDDDDDIFSITTKTKTNTTEDQRYYHDKGVPTLQYIAKKCKA
jgi:hypothetical protein